jgi:hypothetical protein
VGPLYGKVYVYGNKDGKYAARSVGSVEVRAADCKAQANQFNAELLTNQVLYEQIGQNDTSCGTTITRLLGYAYTELGCARAVAEEQHVCGLQFEYRTSKSERNGGNPKEFGRCSCQGAGAKCVEKVGWHEGTNSKRYQLLASSTTTTTTTTNPAFAELESKVGQLTDTLGPLFAGNTAVDAAQDSILVGVQAGLQAAATKVEGLEAGLAAALQLIDVQQAALLVQTNRALANTELVAATQLNLAAALDRLGVADFTYTPDLPPVGGNGGESEGVGVGAGAGAGCATGVVPVVVSTGEGGVGGEGRGGTGTGGLQLGACKGVVQLSAAGCSVDPCVLQQEVARIKLMVGLE